MCVSVQFCMGEGSTPSFLTGGTPILPDRGTPFPGLDRGVPPFQVWMEGTPFPGQGSVPHPRGYPHQQDGVPLHLDLGRGYSLHQEDRVPPCPGLDGVPPIQQDWMGVHPCPKLDGSPHQETEKHSQHLPRGGRYASCVHAGGLSCFKWFW